MSKKSQKVIFLGFFISSFFNKNSDICIIMNAPWNGLLAHLKFLIKRNPE